MRLIIAAFALLCALARPASAESVMGHPIVVDGDSLRFPGTEVRLEGIDAPELDQACERAGQVYRCGREAKDALQALIAGRPVICVGVRQADGTERDRYGRLLGKCRAGDTAINAAMVETGHALALVRYSDDYVEHELRARAAGRGMHGGPFVEPAQWRRWKNADKR